MQPAPSKEPFMDMKRIFIILFFLTAIMMAAAQYLATLPG